MTNRKTSRNLVLQIQSFSTPARISNEKITARITRAILEQDERTPLRDDDLDDELWLALCERISTPTDTEQFQPPVGFYYASRLLQWDVCNGGFAQAACNVPEWFELAAAGYNSLGKKQTAEIIREVKDLLPGNHEAVRQLRAGEIGWEDYFGEHAFAIYDELVLASNDWMIDRERIAYVRANRDAFKI